MIVLGYPLLKRCAAHMNHLDSVIHRTSTVYILMGNVQILSQNSLKRPFQGSDPGSQLSILSVYLHTF